MTRFFARTLAVAAIAVASIAPATAQAAADETVETGRGAGFSASWVERGTTDAGRAAGLRGNTHVGFLQTFQNVGKPLFVDGVIHDYRCRAGQDPQQDECRSLGFHVIGAVKGQATVKVARGLAGGRLVGVVRITDEAGDRRRVPVNLRLRADGDVRPHHFLDEVVSDDFTRRYEEIGRERDARSRGSVAGSKVRAADGLLLRFHWTDVITTA